MDSKSPCLVSGTHDPSRNFCQFQKGFRIPKSTGFLTGLMLSGLLAGFVWSASDGTRPSSSVYLARISRVSTYTNRNHFSCHMYEQKLTKLSVNQRERAASLEPGHLSPRPCFRVEPLHAEIRFFFAHSLATPYLKHLLFSPGTSTTP